MVYATDKAIYSVKTMEDGKLVTHIFQTFAAAAGCAEALTGIRFMDVEFYSVDTEGGRSSISGSLYVYGKNGVRRACNPYLVRKATERGGR